jgi:hypothetical protein
MMTVADDRGSATDSELREQVERWLAGDIDLAPLERISGAVLLFSTEQIQPDGSVVRRRGRAYPCGDLSTADEFWLIERTARDIREDDNY